MSNRIIADYVMFNPRNTNRAVLQSLLNSFTVKTGGDVSIKDNIIEVLDDSHNHIIANIDNLQYILDELRKLDSDHFAESLIFAHDSVAEVRELLKKETDTRVSEDKELSEKIQEIIDSLNGVNDQLGDRVSSLETKTNVLIGDDVNKSVRTIANEELALQLIPEAAKDSLDTLKEIALWIQEHPDDAAAMNLAIQNLEALIGKLPEDFTGDTVIEFINYSIAELTKIVNANAEYVNKEIKRLDERDEAIDTELVRNVEDLNQSISSTKQQLIDELNTVKYDLDAMIHQEITDRSYQDEIIAGTLEREISERQKAVENLTKVVNDNETDIEDKVSKLTELVNANEVDIEAKLTKEVEDRGAAILAEEQARIDANTALEARIKANEDKLVGLEKDTVQAAIDKAEADANAHAEQKIADLVNSAPEALDTLNELAVAITENQSIYDAYVAEHAEAMAELKTILEAADNSANERITTLEGLVGTTDDEAKIDGSLFAQNAYQETEISNLQTAVGNLGQDIIDLGAASEDTKDAINTVNQDLIQKIGKLEEDLNKAIEELENNAVLKNADNEQTTDFSLTRYSDAAAVAEGDTKTLASQVTLRSDGIEVNGVINNDTATLENIQKVLGAGIYEQATMRVNGVLAAYKVQGSVWNDYAELRDVFSSDFDDAIPGMVFTECAAENDTIQITTERLMPIPMVYSDTYGMLIGIKSETSVPVGVSGRVLVYPFEDKKEYNLGDAVCSAPNGKVSKMTREEIKEWPDRILGYVSCIPEYETWANGVEVKDRIWIKLK